MKDEQLPKLGLLGISSHVADLLLVSDGSIESVKEPRMRIAWHVFVFSFIGLFLVQVAVGHFLFPWVKNSTELTLIWRCFLIVSWLYLLCALAFLAYRHYRILLLAKKDLRFIPIAFFFALMVIIYGFLYRDLYVIYPALFLHLNPIIVPGPTRTTLPFPTSYFFNFDFILYSACTSVSVSYPRIVSASVIVSFLNFTEVVATFLVGALLVATFVQNAKPSDRNDTYRDASGDASHH